jgi:isoleucyl-tRNA synthetase
MQQVVLLGRQKREEVRIGLRTPLRCLTIIHRDSELLADIARLEPYVKQELNVLEVKYASDESNYITLAAKPNFPLLGRRLGKRMKEFQQLIGALTPEQIATLQQDGAIELNGESFGLEEIEVLQQARAGTGTLSNSYIAVDLDCALDDALIRGGYAREITNRLQQYRKELGLHVADRITVRYTADGELARAAQENREFIMTATLCTAFETVAAATLTSDVKSTEIDGQEFRFTMMRSEALS